MAISSKEWLSVLLNENGASFYLDNGVVKLSIPPKPLHNMFEGWADIVINYGRSAKYWGLERSYSSSYKFVKDGATILRSLLYGDRSIESKVYLGLLKWNSENGLYELYYKAEIDLIQADDDPKTGITVQVMQDGAAKYIKANEGVTYEIDCDELTVNMDGILYTEIANFQMPDVDLQEDRYTLPISFINSEGISVGISVSSQEFERLPSGIAPYVADSFNCFFNNYKEPLTLKVEGLIKATNLESVSQPNAALLIVDQNAVTRTVFNDSILPFETKSIIVNETFTLASGDRLFLIWVEFFALNSFNFAGSYLKLTFDTRFQATECLANRPLSVFKELVADMTDGRFTGVSTLLEANEDLVLTSGDAIRGIANPKMKTTFSDFYESFGKILGGAVGINYHTQEVLFEKKEYFLDNSIEILDLGEVSNLKISVAKELVYNTIKVGYNSNKTEDAVARQEVNAGQLYSTPITRVKSELNLIVPYRTDIFGIENVRQKYFDLPNTDAQADNSVFVLHIARVGTRQDYLASRTSLLTLAAGSSQLIGFDTVEGILFTPDTPKEIFTQSYSSLLSFLMLGTVYGNFNAPIGEDITGNLYVNGTIVATVTKTGVGANIPFRMDFNTTEVINPSDTVKMEVVTSAGVISAEVTSAGLTMETSGITLIDKWNLYRIAYISATGGDHIETWYNIELLSPKRLLKQNGSLISGSLFALGGELIKFISGDKNTKLITQTSTETVVESGNIRISDLDASFYRPFSLKFSTKVPQNVVSLLQQSGRGYVTGTWQGVRFYGFPQDVSVKPVFEDAQDWTLLCSSLTNPDIFKTINEEGILFEDMGIISHKLPVKFLRVDAEYLSQFHFKQMDTDWFANRIDRYAENRPFFQKWQTNDSFDVQFITQGLSADLVIIDKNKRVVDTITLTDTPNTAIITPNQLYQGSVDCSSLTPGETYWLLATFGAGVGQKQFVSEPFIIADNWDDTLLIEYTHSANQPDMIWNAPYTGKIRIDGFIQKFKPGGRSSQYEDQLMDVVSLDGQPTRGYELLIGGNFGIPDWMIDKINRILMLDNISIDGYGYSADKDAKLEAIETPGAPMAFWTIGIREATNKLGIAIDATGENASELTVEYNINTKGFSSNQSPANQLDTIIQVTDIE